MVSHKDNINCPPKQNKNDIKLAWSIIKRRYQMEKKSVQRKQDVTQTRKNLKITRNRHIDALDYLYSCITVISALLFAVIFALLYW